MNDDWLAILPTALPVSEAIQFANSPSAGAINSFLGTTRERKEQTALNCSRSITKHMNRWRSISSKNSPLRPVKSGRFKNSSFCIVSAESPSATFCLPRRKHATSCGQLCCLPMAHRFTSNNTLRSGKKKSGPPALHLVWRTIAIFLCDLFDYAHSAMLFQIVQILYWFALATWFGGTLFVAISAR